MYRINIIGAKRELCGTPLQTFKFSRVFFISDEFCIIWMSFECIKMSLTNKQLTIINSWAKTMKTIPRNSWDGLSCVAKHINVKHAHFRDHKTILFSKALISFLVFLRSAKPTLVFPRYTHNKIDHSTSLIAFPLLKEMIRILPRWI